MRARICLLFAGMLVASSFGSGGAAADDINLKIRQTDNLVHIVTVLYRKAQLEKIVSKLEVFHGRQAKIRKEEDQSLALVSADLDSAIKGALEDQKYPPRPLLTKVATLTRLLSNNRMAELNAEVNEMRELLKKELDAGQLKTIENSFVIHDLDPSRDDKKMSSDEKISFYVGRVLLDEVTYDLLVKMIKFAKN